MIANRKGGAAVARTLVSKKSVAGRKAAQKGKAERPLLRLVPSVPAPSALAPAVDPLSPKLRQFLETAAIPSPCLVVDTDIVAQNWQLLHRSLPTARIFYAVKANPAVAVLQRLAALGSCFDTASRGEIDLCLKLGIDPSRISFGNTIKKQADIAYAYEKGVRLFAFDSEQELLKLAESAPGAKVFARVLMECGGAEWPLSRKFGCAPKMARDLLLQARDLGLQAVGISFHVGSQQTDLSQYDAAIAQTAQLFEALRERGLLLSLINLGGGFPSRYRTDVPKLEAYGRAILTAMHRHFGAQLPEMIIEPGRGVVGDAGVIQAEVVLVSRKDRHDEKRWVYLDIGKFHGLAETMDEAIKYRFETDKDDGAMGPVVIAGPTCDSADILYEKTYYEMPLDLKPGDKVRILATGAYTTTYSSVCFNGMPPLAAVCI